MTIVEHIADGFYYFNVYFIFDFAKKNMCLILDAGCWILDTGYWMLDVWVWVCELNIEHRTCLTSRQARNTE
jgi:hypothetical protein